MGILGVFLVKAGLVVFLIVMVLLVIGDMLEHFTPRGREVDGVGFVKEDEDAKGEGDEDE